MNPTRNNWAKRRPLLKVYLQYQNPSKPNIDLQGKCHSSVMMHATTPKGIPIYLGIEKFLYPEIYGVRFHMYISHVTFT